MRTVYFFILLLHFCHCFNNRNLLRKKSHPDIDRPCSLNDLDCIRNYFTKTYDCVATPGTADPFIPDKIHLDVPHANLSFILIKPRITGLDNAKIKKFYINKETNAKVLEVEFESIKVDTPKCVVIYNRRGKEPLITTDYSKIDYKKISMTLILPDHEDILTSNVYTYISEKNPKYVLGPAIYKTKDSGFQRAIAEAEMKLDLSLKELFINQGPVLFDKYFESNFCSFY